MKILYLYKWCTFGGVERVLINRALAFKRHGLSFKAKVFFYYSGVVGEFKNYLKKSNLKDYLWICDDPYDERYDLYISIDTEEAFDTFKDRKLILEYHTPYNEHGRYLKDISADKIKAVLVPTVYFSKKIKEIRPELAEKTFIIPNFVIDEGFEESTNFKLPKWELQPVFFIGRTDSLKNPHFLVSALSTQFHKNVDKYILCIVGGSIDERDFIEHVKREKFEHRTVFYPFLKFERVKAFLKLMSKRKAIFASASKGESFGMSVAEAIYFGLPVLISEIPPHRELVHNDERFLFRLNSKEDFFKKLNYISNNYDSLKKDIENFKIKLHESGFLEAWNKFLKNFQ